MRTAFSIIEERGAIVAVGIARQSHAKTLLERQALRELREYLLSKRQIFAVPVRLRGTTFQRRVWNTLLRIPYGHSVTYGSLARNIGRPRAVRAVANAVAANPLAVLVPCHRVVPASGKIGGYRWGSRRKRALLELERGASE